METFVVECGKKEDCRETITCYCDYAADFMRMRRNSGQHPAVRKFEPCHLFSHRHDRAHSYRDYRSPGNNCSDYYRPSGDNCTSHNCSAHNCASCYKSPCGKR